MDDQDNDLRRLLEKNLKIAQENNFILRKLYRSVKLGRFFKIVYWLVIIGIALGLFYFLQPVFEALRDTYGNLSNSFQEFGKIREELPILDTLLGTSTEAE